MKHASRTARWMAGCLLARWCAANDDLSDYKCPRYYRFVTELPYNATGKKLHVQLKQQAAADLAAGLLERP